MKKDFFGSYRSDASRLKGEVLDVVHPKNVGEVRNAVLGNNKVVIRGAGTGLAGGAVPQGEVVLDLSKMIGISNFNKERRVVEIEAGVVLDDLQDYLRPWGCEFPIKPSSHAVATIGGMIATDAVGNRGVKYGKTSNWVKWVEVMDASGHIERKGITEMSDYVGMEGITGVVVRACLKLNPVMERSASLVRLESLLEVVELVRRLKMRRDVSSLEFLDKMMSKGVGFGEDGYYLIVEYENDEGELKGDEYDKVMAMRDAAYPFVAGEGYTRIEDPKVMLDKFPKLMSWLEANGIPTFGHIGVGILHPCFSIDQERLIPEMMKLVKRLGGQVSGEHGIGLLKRGFVEVNDQKILRNVKKRTDPWGKFNMGKVI
ncbi:FAD-binding oxidoreductase [archaeon]|jgi:glycolate oxidase|nr:FAD-binding oxidoreductase [archaeon]MBT7128418.1 FAD-binding oxidoreductase [archaeon]